MGKKSNVFGLLIVGGLLISAAPLTPSELGTTKISLQEIDGATAGNVEVKDAAYQVGNMYSVPLTADVYAAAINNQLVKINGENLSFIAGLDDTLVTLYTGKGDKNAVLVVDPNGFVLGSYDAFDFAAITALTVPTAPVGYKAGSFKYKGQAIEATTVVAEDAVIKYEYTAEVHSDLDLVTITTEGTELSYVPFDEKATVTSTAANFSHWVIGEQIVSYSKTYTFTMFADTIIREVTSDVAVVAAPVVNLYRDDIKTAAMNNIYSVGYELPAGYTLVETGMLFGANPVIGGAGVVKRTARSITANNEFAVKYTSAEKAAAYLVYKDVNGDANVIYDNGNHVEQIVYNDSDINGTGIIAENKLNSYYTNNVVSTLAIKEGLIYERKDDDGGSIKLGTSGANKGIGYSYSLPILAAKIYAKAWDGDKVDLTVNNIVVKSSLPESFSEYSVSNIYSNSLEITGNVSSKKNRFLIQYIDLIIGEPDLTEYDVKVDGDANGTIVSNIAKGTIGTEVTLTITPSDGYRLATLTNNDVDIMSDYDVTTGKATFKISKDGNIVLGTFEAIPTGTVTINPTENGTITADKTSGIVGTEVTLTVQPAVGYRLLKLTHNSTDITANVKEGSVNITILEGDNIINGSFELKQDGVLSATGTVKNGLDEDESNNATGELEDFQYDVANIFSVLAGSKVYRGKNDSYKLGSRKEKGYITVQSVSAKIQKIKINACRYEGDNGNIKITSETETKDITLSNAFAIYEWSFANPTQTVKIESTSKRIYISMISVEYVLI